MPKNVSGQMVWTENDLKTLEEAKREAVSAGFVDDRVEKGPDWTYTRSRWMTLVAYMEGRAARPDQWLTRGDTERYAWEHGWFDSSRHQEVDRPSALLDVLALLKKA